MKKEETVKNIISLVVCFVLFACGSVAEYTGDTRSMQPHDDVAEEEPEAALNPMGEDPSVGSGSEVVPTAKTAERSRCPDGEIEGPLGVGEHCDGLDTHCGCSLICVEGVCVPWEDAAESEPSEEPESVVEPIPGLEEAMEDEKRCLAAVLSETTPETTIITPPAVNAKQGSSAFSRYDITNICDEETFVTDVLVEHLGDKGMLRHLTHAYFGVADDTYSEVGAMVGQSVAISNDTEDEFFSIHSGNGIWMPAGATRTFVLTGVMERLSPKSVEGAAHSGDLHALKLAAVGSVDGESVVLDEHEVPFMVLRQAQPKLVWHEIEEPLVEGMNKVVHLTLQAEPGKPYSVAQVTFRIIATEKDVIVPQEGIARMSLRQSDGERDDFLFYWEEQIPHYGYLARAAFHGGKEVLVTAPDEGAGPLDVEVEIELSSVIPGMSITTELFAWVPRSDVVTVALTELNLNGILAATPEREVREWTSGAIWWSDLSEGDAHVPFGQEIDGVFEQTPSSPDYTTELYVSGATETVTVYAP